MKKVNTGNQGKSSKNESRGIRRRDFFKLVGGGIIVFFLPRCATESNAGPVSVERKLPKDFNAFLHIAEDGTVTCFTGKIEMGQGIITSLAQMMADELDVPFEKVKMVLGDTDLCPWDGGTWGSLTTRAFGPSMRAAAAEAKGVLLELASAKLRVPVTQLEVKDGVIINTSDNTKTVSYAQLTKGKRIEKLLGYEPKVEDYSKFTYVGKPYLRQDARLKVTGEAKYTGDIKMPGMVFARILRPPSHGAKLTKVDYSEAEKITGTIVVRDGDFIAVLNENRNKADEAVVKIKAEYEFNEMPVNDKSIFDWMLKADSSANVEVSAGDLEEGRKLSEKIYESEFQDPYLAHAPIETHTALGQLVGDKLTVWAATQTPYPLRDDLASVLGMPPEKVRVIVPFVGGGFGGKSAYQQGIEAGRLAKLSGKPVMVAWTRDEEFFYDNFHAAGVIKIKSGVDKSGQIKLWDYHSYFSGTRGAEVIYNIPNAKVTDHGRKENAPAVHPFDTGPWRAPNNNTNTFAKEVQIDIMAAGSKTDPVEFRIKNLNDPKMKACIKAVAERFGYIPGKTPTGRGIGVALGTDVGTLVAMMVEVEVDKATGKVKVLRMACAQDMGLCVNPQGATLQMEGCMTMGLGYSFTEELFFEGGNITDRGFDTYQIPRFSWLPKLETIILERKDQPPQGGGEPAIVTVGAAIGNAIFDATGARLYRMPFTPARVLEAMKKA